MSFISEKIKSAVVSVGSLFGMNLAQSENAAEGIDEGKFLTPPDVLRRAAADGAVLLKNEGVLPLSAEDTLAVFGRVQKDWFYVGYGSGGDVRAPYKISLLDALRKNEKIKIDTALADTYEKWCQANKPNHGVWGHWPRHYREMPLDADTLKSAAQRCTCAAVVIGRSSGEDRENALEKGSFYLTDDEMQLLERVSAAFKKVVVILNIGSVMDFSWIEHFGDKIGAVLIAWQGGMESGNAVADILCGDVAPSGKLTDTIAKKYEDYPSSASFGDAKFNNYTEDIYVGYRWFETFNRDAVIYPFGFGLSYTQFKITFSDFSFDGKNAVVRCRVANIGEKYSGRETVQLYIKKPCAQLGNPSRCLVAFKKTKELKPGEECDIALHVPFESFASYDETGVTGYQSAYVAEAGRYEFFLGSDVRSAECVCSHDVDETVLIKQCSQVCAPKEEFEICKAVLQSGKYKLEKAAVNTSKTDLRKIILDNLPKEFPCSENKNITISDVKAGKESLESFVSQLSKKELEALTRGDYVMNSPLGARGNAGAFGGVLKSLREKGVAPVITTDGPSGIRLSTSCSLLPIGTLLACTFDVQLVTEVYGYISKEMKERGTDVLLAPGMNIHRNPLCGRNFEYYSEDPFLTGVIAGAAVMGIQSEGVSACPKHFACNNQEFKRNTNDSRLSERALREIYLKGFEICVKASKPNCIMTSYNKINGVWGHYHYELCTSVLRKEWGYDGVVMTDWWMRRSKSPEFPEIRDNAYRVRAGVDVYMPGSFYYQRRHYDRSLLSALKKNGITLAELQQTALRVLKLSSFSSSYERFSNK